MPTKDNPARDNEPIMVVPSRELIVLYSWKAPARLFKKRNKEFWTTVAAIALLLSVILILIEEWLAILVIASVIFLYYVFSTVPPEEIENQITNRGIKFVGREYTWDQLSCYWTDEKYGQKMVHFGLNYGLIRSLRLLASEEQLKKIEPILKKYLPNEPLPPSFSDRVATWFSEKIPLDIS